MRRVVLLVVAALAMVLAGCATAQRAMERYMGQPIQAAMINNGPPTNAFDMPDGQRAFQWVRDTQYQMPTQVQQQTNLDAWPGLGSATWTTNTQITGGEAIQGRCLYTIIARWDDTQNAWLSTSYNIRPGCG